MLKAWSCLVPQFPNLHPKCALCRFYVKPQCERLTSNLFGSRWVLKLFQMNGRGGIDATSGQFSPDSEQVLVQSAFSMASETAQNAVIRTNQFCMSTTSLPQVRRAIKSLIRLTTLLLLQNLTVK